jgi:V/A-type H+-transporting ATPase subunit K
MDPSQVGLAMIGAGIAIGVAGLGTGIAQGQVGAAAVGATAENPKMFGKAMILVVLPETIVILGFVVAFLIMNA